MWYNVHYMRSQIILQYILLCDWRHILHHNSMSVWKSQLLLVLLLVLLLLLLLVDY